MANGHRACEQLLLLHLTNARKCGLFLMKSSRSSLAPPAEVNTKASAIPWETETCVRSCSQRNWVCFSLFNLWVWRQVAVSLVSNKIFILTPVILNCQAFDFLCQEMKAHNRRDYSLDQLRFSFPSSSFLVIQILSNIFGANLRGRQYWVDGLIQLSHWVWPFFLLLPPIMLPHQKKKKKIVMWKSRREINPK